MRSTVRIPEATQGLPTQQGAERSAKGRPTLRCTDITFVIYHCNYKIVKPVFHGSTSIQRLAVLYCLKNACCEKPVALGKIWQTLSEIEYSLRLTSLMLGRCCRVLLRASCSMPMLATCCEKNRLLLSNSFQRWVHLAADFSHAGALLQNAPARHMLHDPPCCMCCAASRRGTLVASSRQQGHATQKSHNSHIHEYATQCLMHFRRFHQHLPETL